MQVDIRPAADRAADHLVELADQRGEVGGPGVEPRLAGEGEQLLGEFGSALRRALGVVEVAYRLLVDPPLADQFQIARDDLQQVVEIVREARSQLPDRLHLLRLAERVLRRAAA
ncbi:MAG: hypothetical protein AVDCRST_MAG91-3087 [uncultured Sphingomonadaceae bacterium]|uniref:Uncharacterized protein n=1 Tax=uncultured Sphingomonadaceae bacterium TaxID=169976 RepID=A0A6J4TVY2_9SPHN|nr:MAG: hypothetical protein AVDCRST_MAG91-3087 [uncultured Sphingomonadaceae bacterium]